MAKGARDGSGHSAEVFIAKLQQDPSDHEAYLALHAHYRSRNDFASLTNLVAGLATYTQHAAQAAPLFVEAGLLAEHRLNDLNRAEAHYRQALQLAPNEVHASEALQALLERSQRWTDLCEVIDEQLRFLEANGGAVQDRAVLQYRLGELFSKQFDRPDLALSHYRNAYELDPRMLRALYEARQIHLRQGDLRSVCLLYEREASAEPDVARRIGLLRELSETCQQLGDEDGCVAALERARSFSPNDLQIAHALAGALVRRSAREDERTRALDLDRVADLLCDIAESLDASEARPFLASALGHAPWHARALYELEQATPSNSRAALAAHWVAYLANNPDGDMARERRLWLAQAYIDAGQPDDAHFALEPLLRSGDLEATALARDLRGPTSSGAGAVSPARPDEFGATEGIEELSVHDLLPEASASKAAEPDSEGSAQPVTPPSAASAGAATPAPTQHEAGASPPSAAESTAESSKAAGPEPRRARAGRTTKTRGKAGTKASSETSRRAGRVTKAAARPAEQQAPLQTAAEPESAAGRTAAAEPTRTHATGFAGAEEIDAALDALGDERHVLAATEASRAARSEPATGHAAANLDELQSLQHTASSEHPQRAQTSHAAESGQSGSQSSMHPDAPSPGASERTHTASAATTNSPDASQDPSSVDYTLDGAFLDETEAEELAVSKRAFEAAVAQGNHEDALAMAEHILSQDVLDEAAFDFAERRYRRARDFRARAELLLRTAQPAGLPQDLRKQRLRDAISLYEQKVLDPEAAIRTYRVLMELEPHSDEPLRGMARLLERTAQWDALCECLERTLTLQRDSAQRLSVLRRIAEVHRRERQDRSAAADALVRVIAIDPHDRAARQSLTEDWTALKRWNELTQLLEQRISETPGKAERVALLRQLAHVLERQVDDPEAAFEVYERILELVPDDAPALQRMEEMDEAAGLHDRLLTTLERRAARASAAQAANLLVRMATIAEADLMDQERAHAYLHRALEQTPNNSQILTALANLCERAGRFEELLQLLHERLSVEKQAKARAELERRVARVLCQHLHDDDGAAEAYARLNQYEDDLEAWLFLEQHARKRGDLDSLCSALLKLTELEDEPQQRRARLFECAQHLAQLQRASGAIDALAQILLTIDGFDTEARSQLDTLCEASADYRGLTRVLEGLLSQTEGPARRASLASELANLYTTKLPDDARATRALMVWSEADPLDATPWRGLASIYESKRRYKEWLEALDALARLETEADAANAARLAGAELSWTRLKDADAAMLRIEAYLRNTSAPLPASLFDLTRKVDRLAELSSLCEATKRYDEMFALLRERIERADDPAQRIALYRQLATALIEHEQDDDGAREAYEGLLALADDVEALRFVQAWSIRHDDPERLVQTLLRLAHAEPNLEERRDLWMERGRLLRVRLDRPQQAIEAFRQVLALDPTFWPAVDELALSCEAAGDHAGLAEALERKLQNEADADDPVSLLRRLTDLYEGVLADDRRAVHALTRWVELDPAGVEALRRLRKQYERAGQAGDLLRTLDALSGCEREQPARTEATVAAAVLAYEKLSDTDGAIERLAPLVPLRDEAADRALLTIAERARRLPEVYDLLGAAERFEDLVAQLDLAARNETDLDKKIQWLRRAARTLHERINDPDRAALAYEALLELEEDAPALRFLQARALEADEPRALADLLTRLSQIENDPVELRDLLFEYAHLQNFRLREPAVAIPVLQRVLRDLDPNFEPALDELISAAQAANNFPALAQGLSRALDAEGDPARRAELAEGLATLYQTRLHDDSNATRVLSNWIDIEPDNLIPRRKLRALLQKHAQHDALLECLDGLAAHSATREERVEALLSAARLFLGPLRDQGQAFQRLSELMLSGVVQAEDELHALAFETGRLDELCQLYEQSQRYDDLCALLRERADRENDPNQRAELHLRCARVLAETVGDELAAAEAYREALAIRDDQEALRFLCGVAESQDDNDVLNDLLARLIAVTEPSQRPALQLARALVMRDGLNQQEAAIALLTSIVEQRASSGIDPELCAQSITELETTADTNKDWPALALSLEAQLEQQELPEQRLLTALRLADLYEEQLPNPTLAAQALHQACLADPQHLEARQRLRPHLERQQAWSELLAVLDSLTLLETTHTARRAARMAAAVTAYEHLADGTSALTHLAPLLLAADDEAEQLAQTIARASAKGHALASLYVLRARQTTSSEDAEHCWRQAMLIYEQWLNEPSEAFEASLRLLAANPHDRTYLAAVDRLGLSLNAFDRLNQVYIKLVRDAASDTERIELCVRISRLLESIADEQGRALDFAVQAARIAPSDGELLARVELLATKQASHGELLWAQEQRATNAQEPALAIAAWLDAARTADLGLHDREQAMNALRRALALTETAPDSSATIEQLAALLDVERPDLGEQDARRALLRAHLDLAELADPAFRTRLILNAARFAREELADPGASFDVLRGGAGAPPFSDAVLDALEDTAVRIGRLDALDAQLARSIERSDDDQDRLRLLARRARVLQERLQRYDQAAQTYERVLDLAPNDAQAAELLATCLRKAGRHRELLRACERRLTRVPEPERRLPIMREMAIIWEFELKNRASALAIWHDVRALAPQDEEATQALQRLAGD